MQPTILIRGSQCSIVGITSSTLQELEEKFSYEVLGHEYSEKFEKKEWDGRQYVFHDRHFSCGLLHDVCAFLKPKGIKPEIKDFRSLGKRIALQEDATTLRPYQREVVEKALQYKSSSIEVATGGGKTLIGASFIKKLGLKSLFVVPSIEILRQAENMLSNYLDHPVGVIGHNRHEPDFFTVSTWQSLGNDYTEFLNGIDCLVVDEAQHLGAKVLRQIAKDVPATYRLGMSGTLFREDNADLEITAATGPKVASISYSYLTELGYLVPARFWLVRVPHIEYNFRRTYSEVYEDYVIENDDRNRLIINTVKELIDQGRKVLVFVTRINHGKLLAEYGGHEFLYSTHPNREKIIDDFRYGKIRCLVSTSVLNEGFDMPIIDALVLASPTKSIIMSLQRIGRALRPFANKKDAIIVDFADSCRYLNKHYLRRYERYVQEKSWKIERTVSLQVEEDDGW